MDVRAALKSQYHGAFRMLRECVDVCPDALWTAGKFPREFWKIAYHAAFLALPALPSEQARLDATRVVFDIQRQARVDLPTDGELYRYDINHPDTNGMIDYFIRSMEGVTTNIGRSGAEAFRACKWAIDELKQITPIWKLEQTPQGEVWVEEHP